jgi:hypothetical protein
MARQLTREEDVDAVEIGRTAVVGAGSAGLAYQTGVGIHTGLLTTKPGRQIASLMPADQIAGQSVEQILGAGGGAVGSTAFIVGMHLTGDMTPQQSRRMVGRSLARILAFKGTTATTMGVVASTATASTGTPITALSGAAAHNATLAAMGGGATAGGGLGMAAGEIALGGMSFGVGTLFFVGTGYLFKRMDEAEQKATIEARIKLAKENVEEGNQPEWT